MKSIFLFSSRLWFYLSELPPIVLLIFAISFNDKVDSLMQLYPLIIALSLFIIFISVYFFKGVLIKNDEIRVVGLFSGRDKAIINKNKTLAITVLPKGRLKLELFGNSEDFETYAWLKGDGDAEINLFRARANGSRHSAKRILRFFGADNDAIQGLIREDGYFTEDQSISFKSETENECRKILIFFKKTI